MRFPRSLRPAFCLAALGLLAACASPQTEALIASPQGLKARAEIADVPFFPQEELFCGPAALATVLNWAGETVTQQQLAPEVFTASREGTLRTDMLAAARRHGKLAVPVNDLKSLLTEIEAGHPVVVFQNLALSWYPQWHYAVAYGYDLNDRSLLLRSGPDATRRTDLHAFERTWERGDYWALVVLPPDRLPATADERRVTEAAAGLERAQRLEEAATAYRTLLARWPDNFTARMGLGNTLYARKDFAGAVGAFQEAVKRRPQTASAWNNLAYALNAQGKRSEARDAAEQAVRLASAAEAETYRASLREIAGESRQPQ